MKYKVRESKNPFGCSQRCLNSTKKFYQIVTQPKDNLKSLGFSAHIVCSLDCDLEVAQQIADALNKLQD